MRRNLAVAVLLLMFLGVTVPALAQAPPAPAPSPKVTISGLVDMVSSYHRNNSQVDANLSRNGDTDWSSRTRLRPDITAELGTSKFVLGIEIDYGWGQTAGNAAGAGQDVTSFCTNAACVNAPGRAGTNGGLDLNTDTAGLFEVKWGYLEFQAPLIPWATRIRLGGQPWQAMYKSGILHTGDFAGIHVTSTITPQVKFHLTYAQVEEDLSGFRDGFRRGDDYAIVGSVEITPFKGLDLRPLFSYFYASGVTSGASRIATGGVPNAGTQFPANSQDVAGLLGAGAAVAVGGVNNFAEDRYTVGLDARFTSGPFFIDPTILYQFGDRVLIPPTTQAAGIVEKQGFSAWLVDVRGGWRLGPLLLEAGAVYTTGNKAEENLRHGRRTVNYFQPVSADGGSWGGWCELTCLGIDYFNNINNATAGVSFPSHIGYDKYGLMRLATRASYAVTPAFSLRGTIMVNWTAEEVDTSEVLTNATGRVTCTGEAADAALAAVCGTQISDGRGDSRYLGTEIDLGLTWRFAPGIAFDLVGGYMFTGRAYASHFANPAIAADANRRSNRNPQDVQTIAGRIRYSF